MGGAIYGLRGVLPLLLGAPAPSIPRDRAAEATSSTKAERDKLLAELPFANRQDFEFAQRGFVATLDAPKITDDAGATVFDLGSYAFLGGEAPPTANPSLWRQAQLITKNGLFKVHDRIYQVRGFDVSTVSFILTDSGYIVVDPLTSVESARAAMGLVRKHVGDRPVRAVVYSHSHADHFGGVGGITTGDQVTAGRVKVIAPEGFLEHTVAENIIAGIAMSRRGASSSGSPCRAVRRAK